jgi:hypothetical protein
MKTMLFAAAALALVSTAASANPYDHEYMYRHGPYAGPYWHYGYCERVPFDPRCMYRHGPYREPPAYGGGYPHPHGWGYGGR